MQTAKVKAKDMVSSAKEKVREESAKMQGKTGEATAATHAEKEAAKEAAHAKKDQANADKHQEKADHRVTAGRHGHRGTNAAASAVDPAYPVAAGSTYDDPAPASGKLF